MSTAAFLSGVQRFNDEFLAMMGQRVEEILKGGYRSDVRVDLEHLSSEQVDRATWLANAMERGLEDDSDRTVAAMRSLTAAVPLPE